MEQLTMIFLYIILHDGLTEAVFRVEAKDMEECLEILHASRVHPHDTGEETSTVMFCGTENFQDFSDHLWRKRQIEE